MPLKRTREVKEKYMVRVIKKMKKQRKRKVRISGSKKGEENIIKEKQNRYVQRLVNPPTMTFPQQRLALLAKTVVPC